MEFKEYQSPETRDYDLRVTEMDSVPFSQQGPNINQARMNALMEEYEYIIEDADLEQMGISQEEYLAPTFATVCKVESMFKEQLGRSR